MSQLFSIALIGFDQPSGAQRSEQVSRVLKELREYKFTNVKVLGHPNDDLATQSPPRGQSFVYPDGQIAKRVLTLQAVAPVTDEAQVVGAIANVIGPSIGVFFAYGDN